MIVIFEYVVGVVEDFGCRMEIVVGIFVDFYVLGVGDYDFV